MIRTRSSFYLGVLITEDNCKLDFDEGSGELTATLDIGSYTPTEIAEEVEDQLNETGTLTYTVTFNRTTRILTIAASGSVELLAATGTNIAVSAYSTLGYAATDVTGTSLAAGTALGTDYRPQFILQSYISPEHQIEQLHSTVNETITGRQELITYGDMGVMRCNIMFITDIAQPSDGPIENNASAVSQALVFLDWITKKNLVEFMPDRATPGTFVKLVLDSSAVSKDGTKYRLRELYDKGLCEYYETENMSFRKVDQ